MWRASVVAWALVACGARVQHDPVPPGDDQGGGGSGSSGSGSGSSGGSGSAGPDGPMCFERVKLPSAWWGAEAQGDADLDSLPCPTATAERLSNGICVFGLSRLDPVPSESEEQAGCCYLGRILHCR